MLPLVKRLNILYIVQHILQLSLIYLCVRRFLFADETSTNTLPEKHEAVFYIKTQVSSCHEASASVSCGASAC